MMQKYMFGLSILMMLCVAQGAEADIVALVHLQRNFHEIVEKQGGASKKLIQNKLGKYSYESVSRELESLKERNEEFSSLNLKHFVHDKPGFFNSFFDRILVQDSSAASYVASGVPLSKQHVIDASGNLNETALQPFTQEAQGQIRTLRATLEDLWPYFQNWSKKYFHQSSLGAVIDRISFVLNALLKPGMKKNFTDKRTFYEYLFKDFTVSDPIGSESTLFKELIDDEGNWQMGKIEQFREELREPLRQLAAKAEVLWSTGHNQFKKYFDVGTTYLVQVLSNIEYYDQHPAKMHELGSCLESKAAFLTCFLKKISVTNPVGGSAVTLDKEGLFKPDGEWEEQNFKNFRDDMQGPLIDLKKALDKLWLKAQEWSKKTLIPSEVAHTIAQIETGKKFGFTALQGTWRSHYGKKYFIDYYLADIHVTDPIKGLGVSANLAQQGLVDSAGDWIDASFSNFIPQVQSELKQLKEALDAAWPEAQKVLVKK